MYNGPTAPEQTRELNVLERLAESDKRHQQHADRHHTLEERIRRLEQAIQRFHNDDSSKVYLTDAIYEVCVCEIRSYRDLLVDADELQLFI